MKKRLLSLSLAICLILTMLPTTATAATNQSEIVKNTITNYISLYNSSFRSSYSGKAWGCFAFCNYVWKGVFGKDYYANRHTTVKSSGTTNNIYDFLSKNYAKTGDILWCHNNSTTHSMIILAYDSDGVWLSDGKSNGSLWHHNTKISYDDTSYKKYFGGDCGLTLYKVNDVLWNSVNGNYENLPAPTFPNNIGESSQNTAILTVSSTISGKWAVTIPANYKLICYDSASTAKSSTYYIAAKTSSYTLTCTQQATLSNGKTRYFFVSGDGKNLWFDYTSGMSVVPSTTTAATSYTVTFNPNGGSISQTSKMVTSGQKYDVLPMPSWNGYTFDGWYTSASGGTQVTAATTVTLSGNQTLYAHWTKNPTATYTVTFDPNGGSVWPTTKTLTAGTLLTGMPTPTRNGYIFRGWAMDKIDPDGNGVNVTTIVADGVWTFDKDTILYAHWAKEPSTNPPQNTSQNTVKPTSFDYSGKFGVNNALTWGLNTSTGVLVLSGNGKMQNWSNAEYRPWAKLRNNVTGVIIEDGIQNLGGAALARFENMTSVSIPESVTEIGASVFIRAYSLASIDLPQNLTTIGSGAFSECTSLRSITIPKNVGFIETGAFSGCSNLESIYFCGNAPSYFGDNGVVRLNMFSGCRNLTVYYPANSSGWAPIIEKYTDVTWRTWNPGSTVSSNPAPAVANTTTWGSWSAWSTTPYSASSTRQVETQQVKVSDAYTEYRYGLWRNTNNASWCPDYGASLSSSGGSWYESYSNWSKTRLYRDTGHNAFCSGGNHNHTHVAGYDSSGQAYWDIYSDDGTFTGWGRLYYYWEETRTIPAVYETQYRYRDLISA